MYFLNAEIIYFYRNEAEEGIFFSTSYQVSAAKLCYSLSARASETVWKEGEERRARLTSSSRIYSRRPRAQCNKSIDIYLSIMRSDKSPWYTSIALIYASRVRLRGATRRRSAAKVSKERARAKLERGKCSATVRNEPRN